jgi:hypothetical protein
MSAMGEDASRPGIRDRLYELLFSRKAAVEEPQDVQLVEEGVEVEGNESPIREGETFPAPSTPRAQPATAELPILKSPSRVSGSLAKPAKRKRTSNSERQDLYDVPADATPDSSEQEEVPTNRPAKRARGNGRAKPPLTIPKTSRGHISSHQIRQTRGNRAVEGEDVEMTADVPASSPVKGVRAANFIETEQPKPKKRGRPPKNKNPPSEMAQQAAFRNPERTAFLDRAIPKSVATANCPDVNLQDPRDADEGISDILLNPSPIKVGAQELRPTAGIAQQKRPPQSKHHLPAMDGMPELSADEEELFGSNCNPEESAEVPNELEDEEQEAGNRDSDEPHPIPFDPKLIDGLWETSKHVGKKFDMKEKTWPRKGRTEKLWTGPGKRMAGQLETIISGYKNLEHSKSSRNKRAFQDAHKEVENVFNIISKEAEVVLAERFGPDSDAGKGETMLTDLYFNIIPKCIHALKNVVAVYNIQGSMTAAALEETLKLVDLLYDLSSTAIRQPKEIQPKPEGNVSYQISQPTRHNLPEIRTLQKMISAELSFREREKERAEEELLRPERERQLLEDKEREDAEILRKREERRRLQGESWWAVRNTYFSGPWHRILQSDIAKLEAVKKGKGRQESVELGYPPMTRAQSRRANSEESGQGVERVSVFPGNNIKANSSMSLLSREDTLVFIDCMRYEQGKETLRH